MPFESVNMAVPFKENRESQIYFLSSSENRSPEDSAKKKYVIIKAFQLLITLCSILFFYNGVMVLNCGIEDIIISTLFGAIVFHTVSLLWIYIKIKEYARALIWFNMIALGISFVVGGLTIKSFWTTQEMLKRLENDNPEGYTNAQASSTMKLISATLSAINGVIYLLEIVIMLIEIKGK